MIVHPTNATMSGTFMRINLPTTWDYHMNRSQVGAKRKAWVLILCNAADLFRRLKAFSASINRTPSVDGIR